MLGINSQRPEAEFGGGPDNLWALRTNSFLVIECKNSTLPKTGISKHDLGQLEQSMSWFQHRYGQDAIGVPVIIHPMRKLNKGASSPKGLRVIEADRLSALKGALVEFVTSVGATGALNNIKKVRDALAGFGLSEDKLLETFTVTPKP